MERNSKKNSNSNKKEKENFHVFHKVPIGDGPYVQAKHIQIVEKDPEGAIVMFWKAINERDKIDSALKDMALVMKQLNRSEEAIEAIKSFRGLCSKHAQESLDNVLIDLYKKCGKVDEQIMLIKRKLRLIYEGQVFNGKPTKTARSHGKKFQVSIKQETSRLLGNLGWMYMQKENYMAAEVVYRKAQMIDPDANKACNLSICLINHARYEEARSFLLEILQGRFVDSENSNNKIKAKELMMKLESKQAQSEPSDYINMDIDEDFFKGLDDMMNQWGPFRSKRLPIFEEITPLRNKLAC